MKGSRRDLTVTLIIAASAGVGSMSFNFWVPFLPLFLVEIGAKNDAEAVFWIAIATSAQGVARLATGPLWGVLSDRYGRKMMLLRALYFGTATTIIAALVTDPWQIVFAFTCQGLLSGFIPAAVALTSVSVPDSRLGWSLSLVTGAQYLGNTLGPAIGAGLALLLDYRGAIVFAAMLPSLAGTAVLFLVPADRVERSARERARAEGGSVRSILSLQFGIAVLLLFSVFALTQLLRIVTPVALRQIDEQAATAASGVTFTLGGLASAVAVLGLAARLSRPGRLKSSLALGSALAAGGHLLLAVAGSIPLFVAAFAFVSLTEAAMAPAINTLIAGAAPRARRGTAFGVASSAQALAFMAGPLAAALFAAVSLSLGFAILAGLLAGLALLVLLVLREPPLEAEASAAAGAP